MKRLIPNIHIYRFSTIALGILVPVLLYVIIFFVFSSPENPPVRLIEAFREVRLTQSIEPLNPLQKVSEAEINDLAQASLVDSWSVITPEISTSQTFEAIEVPSPVVAFEGLITRKNSRILLEISSVPTLIMVRSDVFGSWTWTNFGYPLSEGKHTLAVYVLATNDAESKVFVQEYTLNVGSETELGDPPIVKIPEQGEPVTILEDSLASQLHDDSREPVLLFSQNINHDERSKFFQGETLDVYLDFIPMKSFEDQSATLTYELYDYQGGYTNIRPIATSVDNVTIPSQGISFTKHLALKFGANPGTYTLKTFAEIGSKRYLQQSSFLIRVRPFTPFALSNTFAQELQETRVIGLNIIIFLIIIVMILVLTLLEYRRFFMFPPIDEDVLVKKGYFIIKKK